MAVRVEKRKRKKERRNNVYRSKNQKKSLAKQVQGVETFIFFFF